MTTSHITPLLIVTLLVSLFQPYASAGDPATDFAVSIIRGTVTDADGSPLVGASVLVNKYEGGPIEPRFPETTAADNGKFELRLTWREPVTIKEVWVSHPGFVRFERTDHVQLKRDQVLSLDFKLQRGDVIAGKVEDLLQPGPRESARCMLHIQGEGFDQILATRPGGEFELWVPPGVYTIETLGLTKIKETGVRAGTKDLVLKPRQAEITPELLATAFDDMWTAMDQSYSYFAYKPEVDWSQLREQHRPRAIAAKTRDEFIDETKSMLANLKDMHVWIETENGIVGTYGKSFQRNWNPQSMMKSWASSKQYGNFSIVGKTRPDGFGFVVIDRQSRATPENVKQTVDAIQALAGDVPGFIVDLRGGASGGSEPLAQQLAQAFCDKDVVYAKHKYRNGPAHDAFGAERERILPASPGKPFTKPVVCLIGQRCMSSGEALVQMFKVLPHATLIGMRTRGSSGNPKPAPLEGLNAVVLYSTWVDMNADGSLVDGVGIPPHNEINEPVEAYENADPTWDRALVVLREKVAESDSPAK